MRRPSPTPLPLLLALAAMAVLPGCDGLDTGTDSLPDPAIFAGADVEACSGAGALSIQLAVVGTRVVEGFPQTSQTGPNRVEVSGRVTGLAATDSIYGVVVGLEDACPLGSWAEVAPAADGSFLLTVGIGTRTGFRVVALAGPAGSTPVCGAAVDCLQLDAAGTVVPATGISNAVAVRLPV